MSAIYRERGESIDFLNDGNDIIQALDVVPVGADRIGVAGCPILPDAVGSLHVMGVFSLPKAQADVFAVGAAVKYDAAAGTVSAANGIPAGWVVKAAKAGETTVDVKIG